MSRNFFFRNNDSETRRTLPKTKKDRTVILKIWCDTEGN